MSLTQAQPRAAAGLQILSNPCKDIAWRSNFETRLFRNFWVIEKMLAVMSRKVIYFRFHRRMQNWHIIGIVYQIKIGFPMFIMQFIKISDILPPYCGSLYQHQLKW